MKNPKARSEGLIITEAGDDLLVYDQRAQAVHSLSSSAKTVWLSCNGTFSLGDIAKETGLPMEIVESAITMLSDSALLDEPFTSHSPSRQNRRKMLARSGLAATLPVILSVTARSAQAANSQCLGALITTRYEDCTARPNCCDEDLGLTCVPYTENQMICDESPNR